MKSYKKEKNIMKNKKKNIYVIVVKNYQSLINKDMKKLKNIKK